MDLRADLVGIPLEQRFTYDPLQNVLFINFERFALHSRADIDAIEKMVERSSAALGRARLRHRQLRQLHDPAGTARRLHRPWCAGSMDRFYSGVSRYTTSGFLRMKLGESLKSAASPRTSSRARRRRARTGARRRSRGKIQQRIPAGTSRFARAGVRGRLSPACFQRAPRPDCRRPTARVRIRLARDRGGALRARAQPCATVSRARSDARLSAAEFRISSVRTITVNLTPILVNNS